jgi:hypothetical protein
MPFTGIHDEDMLHKANERSEMIDHIKQLTYTSGILDGEIRRLRNAIKLAECQHLGCGGRLSPDEIVVAMRKILSEALEK